MQGAGNDYIYIDATSHPIHISPEQIAQLCNRHFGIGSDGVVLIKPSQKADFRMEMYNADGSESEMRGNASRCIGKFVYDKGLTTQTTVSLETKAGIKTLELHVKENKVKSVTVDMGEPILTPHLIPFRADIDTKKPLINTSITVANRIFYVTPISMGNPHAVLIVDEFTDKLVHQEGAKIEDSDHFPKKTNVEFIRILDRNTIEMRVWERGIGETLACGTGACASLVAAVLNDRTERKATLKLLGGDLIIEWNKQNNHVYMTGPADFTFEGTTDILKRI